jgi:hypothetical protein
LLALRVKFVAETCEPAFGQFFDSRGDFKHIA